MKAICQLCGQPAPVTPNNFVAPDGSRHGCCEACMNALVGALVAMGNEGMDEVGKELKTTWDGKKWVGVDTLN